MEVRGEEHVNCVSRTWYNNVAEKWYHQQMFWQLCVLLHTELSTSGITVMICGVWHVPHLPFRGYPRHVENTLWVAGTAGIY